jgi:D-amino peptidase
VTGDQAACREATELLGDGVVSVQVKESYSARAARMVQPKRARHLIEEGARRALADLRAVAPYDPGRPCEIRIEYKRTDLPDALRYRPGVERVDGRTVVSRAETWWDAWRQFYF